VLLSSLTGYKLVTSPQHFQEVKNCTLITQSKAKLVTMCTHEKTYKYFGEHLGLEILLSMFTMKLPLYDPR